MELKRKVYIYWDTSDPQDKGWAYQYWLADNDGWMSNVDSGALDNTNPDADWGDLLDELKGYGYEWDEYEINK